MKQTVLHQKHLQAGARLSEFQGWHVPLSFSDVTAEYQAVRAAAGLFDIGCLGRIEISGPGALSLLQSTLTRNATKIPIGSAQAGLICNESGCILDSVLIYHLAGSRYLLTTNASNAEKVLLWLKQHAGADANVVDTTQSVAQIALQGPRSFHFLEKLAGTGLAKMNLKAVRELTVQGAPLLVSRTGYTGEQGYELFAPAERAEALWDGLLAAGSGEGLLPCGFACRDLLRLESGYLSYGNELDETRTPLEAGLSALVDFKKDFIGKEALLKIRGGDLKQKLVGFTLLDKGVPKNGGSIFSESREIGQVTSSVHSPRFRTGIGFGYVVSRYAQSGQEIEIEVRDREVTAKIVDLPFFKK